MSSGPQGTSVSRDKGQKNHLIIIIFAIIFVIIIIIIIISIIITFLLINFLFSIWQNKKTIVNYLRRSALTLQVWRPLQADRTTVTPFSR